MTVSFSDNDPIEKIVEEIIAFNFNSPLPSCGSKQWLVFYSAFIGCNLNFSKEQEDASQSDFFGGNIVGPSAGYDSDSSEASRAREKKRLKKIKSEAKLAKKK